jgi:hypothetical protein
MAVAEGVEVARTGATVGEKVECVQRFLTGLRDHRIFTFFLGGTEKVRKCSGGNLLTDFSKISVQ